MKTFVDAQKDYDQLEIYRKWLRDNNVSFQGSVVFLLSRR